VSAAAALNCDPSYVALPALAVAASAVGNSRAVALKATWREPPILWTVIVGDSGTLKTPALRLALQPMLAAQQRRHLVYKEQLAQHTREKAARGKADGDPPPVLEQCFVSDITVERLAEVLEDNPRGLLVARDELSGWLASFTRYKGRQGGTDLP